MDEHKRIRMKRSNFSNVCHIGFSGAMDGAYVFGVVFCGYGIINGTMSYGNVMAVLQLIAQVQNPFANITGYLPQYYAMLASAERLREVEQFRPMQNADCSKEELVTFYHEKLKALCFEDAQFTYEEPFVEGEDCFGKRVVLDRVNLRIGKGEFIAVTGPSGCGKSTFLKLLMCLYDLDAGKRLIESKDGTLPLTGAYRSLFAYVPQGNQLMTGSIRNIIAFGDQSRMQEDEAMLRALRIACADTFVLELEKGLDTELGERGAGLSEGQMQRIAIARAIFSGNPILLLDESTSALDEATAMQLLKNLRRLTDMTVVLVTHRTAHMELFDREIMFSDDGVVLK